MKHIKDEVVVNAVKTMEKNAETWNCSACEKTRFFRERNSTNIKCYNMYRMQETFILE